MDNMLIYIHYKLHFDYLIYNYYIVFYYKFQGVKAGQNIILKNLRFPTKKGTDFWKSIPFLKRTCRYFRLIYYILIYFCNSPRTHLSCQDLYDS